MVPDIGRALEGAAKIIAVLVIVFVPLGLWKMVEIAIWLYKHVDIKFL